MKTKENRQFYIDALKGLGIVLVVFGHVLDGYIRGNIYPDSKTMLFAQYNTIYAFHMPLFFILSGYVYQLIFLNDEGIVKSHSHLKSQIVKCIYLYFVWSIILGLFKVVFSRFTNTGVSFSDILLIPVKTIPPYWYLYVLVAYYLIFSIKFLYKHEKITFFVLLSISALAFILPFISWLDFTHVLYYLVYFYTGILLCKHKISSHASAIIFLLFAISIFLNIQNIEVLINYTVPINIICGLGYSLFVFWIFQRFQNWFKPNNILVFLGKNSLEIFVLHCYFTGFFRVILFKGGYRTYILI